MTFTGPSVGTDCGAAAQPRIVKRGEAPLSAYAPKEPQPSMCRRWWGHGLRTTSPTIVPASWLTNVNVNRG